MNKRIAFALAAVLLVIGYLAQPESDPPAGDEAAEAQETGLAEPTMTEVWASMYRLRVLGQWFDGIRFYAAASSPRRSRRTWAGLR